MRRMPQPPTFWDAIDAVVVINLDHRADRWAQIQSHLAPIVPVAKLHRLSAVRGVDLPGYGQGRLFGRTKRPTTWGGRGGCALSHRNALRLAAHNNWQQVLILEDDARFTQPLGGTLGSALAAFLSDPKRAPGVCFLGQRESRGPVRLLAPLDESHVLCQIGGCLAAHAYIVDAPVRDLLLARLPQHDAQVWSWLARHVAVDTWYGQALSGLGVVTAVSPGVVAQEACFSEILQREVEEVVGAAEDSRVGRPCSPACWPWAIASARAKEMLGAPVRGLKWLGRWAVGF